MLLSSPCLGVSLEDLELDRLSPFAVVDIVTYAEVLGIGLELKTAHLSVQSHVRHAPAFASPMRSTPLTTPVDASACRADALGILRLEHPSRNVSLASAGQTVTAGDPVALLQVGVRYTVVRAGINGKVKRSLVAPGTLVGYGDPLIEFIPEVAA